MGVINRLAQITISSSCSLFTGSSQNHEHPLRLLSNSSQGNVPQRSQLPRELSKRALTIVTPSFTDGTWGLFFLEVSAPSTEFVPRTKKLSHNQGQGRQLTHNRVWKCFQKIFNAEFPSHCTKRLDLILM